MTYNATIVREQGGSVLNVGNAGLVSFASGASLSLAAGTKLDLGTGTQLLFGALTSPPTVTAVPGSVYFRSDGSVSNIYVNTSTGTTGSVWKSACIVN